MRFCNHYGCPALVESGYCDKHKRTDSRKQYDKNRGSSTERGYDYTWSKVRKLKLQINSLCEDCLSKQPQKLTPAVEVHHIQKITDAPELRLEISNMMSLCKPCHTIRTNRGE